MITDELQRTKLETFTALAQFVGSIIGIGDPGQRITEPMFYTTAAPTTGGDVKTIKVRSSLTSCCAAMTARTTSKCGR